MISMFGEGGLLTPFVHSGRQSMLLGPLVWFFCLVMTLGCLSGCFSENSEQQETIRALAERVQALEQEVADVKEAESGEFYNSFIIWSKLEGEREACLSEVEDIDVASLSERLSGRLASIVAKLGDIGTRTRTKVTALKRLVVDGVMSKSAGSIADGLAISAELEQLHTTELNVQLITYGAETNSRDEVYAGAGISPVELRSALAEWEIYLLNATIRHLGTLETTLANHRQEKGGNYSKEYLHELQLAGKISQYLRSAYLTRMGEPHAVLKLDMIKSVSSESMQREYIRRILAAYDPIYSILTIVHLTSGEILGWKEQVQSMKPLLATLEAHYSMLKNQVKEWESLTESGEKSPKESLRICKEIRLMWPLLDKYPTSSIENEADYLRQLGNFKAQHVDMAFDSKVDGGTVTYREIQRYREINDEIRELFVTLEKKKMVAGNIRALESAFVGPWGYFRCKERFSIAGQ